MFILRTIFEEQPAQNIVLGDHYSYIDRGTDYERFRVLFEHVFNKPHIADLDEAADYDTQNVYGIITSGREHHALYKGMRAYIMTEGGKTFENLSFG